MMLYFSLLHCTINTTNVTCVCGLLPLTIPFSDDVRVSSSLETVRVCVKIQLVISRLITYHGKVM